MLLSGITEGNPTVQRRAMAKAITLLESTRADHRLQADELLTALLPHTGRALRLGISGVPGVGKSTFIEALGLYLIEQGHRVAVLAICEAAGYDIVIVETVGVGQSEPAVHGMTDMFCLLQLPNAGDELQAIKKGVMELADLVVINKADLDPLAATRAQSQIQSSLRLFGQHGNPEHAHHDESLWQPTVVQLSALQGQGVTGFWQQVSRFRQLQTDNGRFAAKRQRQARSWMWERIEAGLRQRFRDHPAVKAQLDHTTEQVLQGLLPASTAARQLLELFN